MMTDNTLLTNEPAPDDMPLAMKQALEVLNKMDKNTAWEYPKVVLRIHDAYQKHEPSNAILEESGFDSVFLQNRLSGVEYGRTVYRILQDWASNPFPTLASIVLRACTKFKISPEDQKILMVATALGSVENPLEYHNVSHNRKVLLQTVRLATASFDLSAHDIAKLIIAACIQDIGHDGKGNTVDGKHVSLRLETQSMKLAEPYLQAAGLSTKDFKDISHIVAGTDVTPLGSFKAPARMLAGDPSKLPDTFYTAKKDQQLLKLIRMLATADVASAAALCCELSFDERSALSKELSMNSIVTIDAFLRFMKAVEPTFNSLPETVFVYGDAPRQIEQNIRPYFEHGTKKN